MTFDDARYIVQGDVTFPVWSAGIGDFDGDLVPDLLYSDSTNYAGFVSRISIEWGLVFVIHIHIKSHRFMAMWLLDSGTFIRRYVFIDDFDGDGYSEIVVDMVRGNEYGGSDYIVKERSDYIEAHPLNVSVTLTLTYSWLYGKRLPLRVYNARPRSGWIGWSINGSKRAQHNFIRTGKAYLYYGSTMQSLQGTIDVANADRVFIGVKGTPTPTRQIWRRWVARYHHWKMRNRILALRWVYILGKYAEQSTDWNIDQWCRCHHYRKHKQGYLHIIDRAGDVDGDGKDDSPSTKSESEFESGIVKDIPNAGEISLSDVDGMYFDGQEVTTLIFNISSSAGDIDGDGLGISWWTGIRVLPLESSIFTGQSIATVVWFTDTGQDTWDTSAHYRPFKTDLLFKDVLWTYHGDIDEMGWMKCIRKLFDEYAAYGGVIGIFSVRIETGDIGWRRWGWTAQCFLSFTCPHSHNWCKIRFNFSHILIISILGVVGPRCKRPHLSIHLLPEHISVVSTSFG